MTAKRTSLWHHPAKPEGALHVAVFIMQNYAYAGHGEIDSFDHMADCATLQTSLDQRKDLMLRRLRTVHALEKFCAYPFDLGRHEHK